MSRKLKRGDSVTIVTAADGERHLLLDNAIFCGADVFPLTPDKGENPWCAACEEAFNSRPLTLVK